MKKIIIVIVLLSSCLVYSQQSVEVFKLGVEASRRGDNELADSLFCKSIEYGRGTTTITFENYYNCGIVKRELNQQDLAIAYFDTAIYMNPRYFPSYHNRGIACYYNSDYENCLKSVDEGLKLKSDDLDILVLGAMASLADSSYEKGKVYCSKGKLVRKDSRFYGIQALLFLQNGELEKAKKEIQLGETYFKDNNDILEAKLYYCFLKKDFESMTPIVKRLGRDYPFLINEKSFKDKINTL
jgi:tetratricopeptide (TPR) repeat protein